MVLYFYRSKDDKRGYVGRDASEDPLKRIKEHIADAYGSTTIRGAGSPIKNNKPKNKSARVFLDYGACGVKYAYFSSEENFGIPQAAYKEILNKWIPTDANGKELPMNDAVKLSIAEMYYISYYAVKNPNFISENSTQGGELKTAGNQLIYFKLRDQKIVNTLKKIRIKLGATKVSKTGLTSEGLAENFYSKRVKIGPYIRLIEPELSSINLWLIEDLNDNFFKSTETWSNIVSKGLTAIKPDGKCDYIRLNQIIGGIITNYWNSQVDLIGSELKELNIKKEELKLRSLNKGVVTVISKKLGKMNEHIIKKIQEIITASPDADVSQIIDTAARSLTTTLIFPSQYKNWGLSIKERSYYDKTTKPTTFFKQDKYTPMKPNFNRPDIEQEVKRYCLWHWYAIIQRISHQENYRREPFTDRMYEKIAKENINVIDKFFGGKTLKMKFENFIKKAPLKTFKRGKMNFYHELASWAFGQGLFVKVDYEDSIKYYYSSLDPKMKVLRFHFKSETKDKIELMKKFKMSGYRTNNVPTEILNLFEVY